MGGLSYTDDQMNAKDSKNTQFCITIDGYSKEQNATQSNTSKRKVSLYSFPEDQYFNYY
jgi:hypothetical protein